MNFSCLSVLFLLLVVHPSDGKHHAARRSLAASSNDDVAGPIVKLSDLKQQDDKNETAGASPSPSAEGTGTLAQILDAALQKEFTKETAAEDSKGVAFNATVQQGGEEVWRVWAATVTG